MPVLLQLLLYVCCSTHSSIYVFWLVPQLLQGNYILVQGSCYLYRGVVHVQGRYYLYIGPATCTGGVLNTCTGELLLVQGRSVASRGKMDGALDLLLPEQTICNLRIVVYHPHNYHDDHDADHA